MGVEWQAILWLVLRVMKCGQRPMEIFILVKDLFYRHQSHRKIFAFIGMVICRMNCSMETGWTNGMGRAQPD